VKISVRKIDRYTARILTVKTRQNYTSLPSVICTVVDCVILCLTILYYYYILL